MRGINVGVESVSRVISKALSGDRPILQLRHLTEPLTNKNVAPELQERAKAGFLSGLFEHVIGVEAGLQGAQFSAISAYKKLFSPIPRAGAYRPSMRNPRTFEKGASGGDLVGGQRISLMELLQKENVISELEATRLERLMRELVRYETLDKAGKLDSALTEGAGPMLDFYLRMAGSALGTSAQKAMPLGSNSGASLIAAGAGSKLVRTLFDEMPQVSALQAMQEMLENPALLAQMLRKPRSQQEATSIAQVVKGYLIRAGIINPSRRVIPAADDAGTTPTEATPAPRQETPGKQSSLYGSRFSRQPNQQVAQAPQQQPEPFLAQIAQAAQPAQAPANAPRPAGRVNPETVKKMAALFPEGGIASMTG
jgi:hypothetical protein